jgi:hypothetical protein
VTWQQALETNFLEHSTLDQQREVAEHGLGGVVGRAVTVEHEHRRVDGARSSQRLTDAVVQLRAHDHTSENT